MPSVTTTYTLTGTVNGCSAAKSLIVTVNSLPAVTIIPANATICSGSSVIFTVLVGGTVIWSPTTGLQTTSGPLITASPVSTITYTVTDIAVNGCTNSTQITIGVNNLPTVTAFGSATICAGNHVNLSSDGASSYSWTPSGSLSPATGASVTASPTITTTYTVTGTDNNNCSNKAFATIVVNTCTGIEEELYNNTFNLYPNPTNGNLTISFTTPQASNFTIRVIDMTGKEVYRAFADQYTGEYKSEIDLSKQSKGIYLITIITDQGTLNRKIILE